MRLTGPALVLLIALSSSGMAGEDVVLLKNGQRIHGTVDPTQDLTATFVIITTPTGTLRLRSDLIRDTKPSYESQRARVKDDNYAGLLALARWCLTEKMRDRAIELLKLASALPDATPDAIGLLARLTDETSPEAALPLYRKYKALGGMNAEFLARLQQLDDAIALYEKQVRDSANPVEQPTLPAIADGLEAKAWDAESTQWSNPVAAEVITLAGKDGTNRIVRLTYGPDKEKPKDKAVIKKPVRGLVLESPVLRLWAANPTDHPVQLALSVKTGNYVFHESHPITIPPKSDWKELRYDLKNDKFKSEGTKWEYSGGVDNLHDIKELGFLLYNGQTSGVLDLDGIGFLHDRGL